jgi:hypothetical protein
MKSLYLATILGIKPYHKRIDSRFGIVNIFQHMSSKGVISFSVMEGYKAPFLYNTKHGWQSLSLS